MEKQDLISVIIPIYNMEKYLSRCLDSVCNNSYKNLEIICVNDGSNDSSLSILEEYKKKDDRIIIIDQENKKLSASRNAGMDIARGEWIAFIDSDDWVHPQYFEILLYISHKTNADISICDSITSIDSGLSDELLDINAVEYRTITKKELVKLRVARNRVWGKLYRKDIIGDLRFIPGSEPTEDILFNTTLYSEQMRYGFTECKLYYYFIRRDSAMQTYTGKQALVYTQYMIPLIANETSHEKNKTWLSAVITSFFHPDILKCFQKTLTKQEKE